MQLIGQRGANPVTSNKLGSKKAYRMDRIHVPERYNKASTYSVVKYLSGEIYRNEKLKGFYRGYFLSTFLVSFNSSLWWPFYYFYQSELS